MGGVRVSACEDEHGDEDGDEIDVGPCQDWAAQFGHRGVRGDGCGYSRITGEALTTHSMYALAHIRSMQPWTEFVTSSCSMLQTSQRRALSGRPCWTGVSSTRTRSSTAS